MEKFDLLSKIFLLLSQLILVWCIFRQSKIALEINRKIFEMGIRVNALIYWRSKRDIERLKNVQDLSLQELSELNEAEKNVDEYEEWQKKASY